LTLPVFIEITTHCSFDFRFGKIKKSTTGLIDISTIQNSNAILIPKDIQDH